MARRELTAEDKAIVNTRCAIFVAASGGVSACISASIAFDHANAGGSAAFFAAAVALLVKAAKMLGADKP
jgi:hypothetical protein